MAEAACCRRGDGCAPGGTLRPLCGAGTVRVSHGGRGGSSADGTEFLRVDPRSLPTPAAWEIGKQLGDQVIERYILEEGHYPENIGMVFWSGANMRSRGQCVAEFLYLMGLRPVWQPGSLYVKGTEVIPLEELKRPRIDVTARISGLFRDTMGSVISLMDALCCWRQDLMKGRKIIISESISGRTGAGLEAAGQTEAEAWRTALTGFSEMRRGLTEPEYRLFWRKRTGRLLMILPGCLCGGAAMPTAAAPGELYARSVPAAAGCA